MKFVVLGGYGIIGKHVVADLAKFAKGSEIIIAGRDLEKATKYAKYFSTRHVHPAVFDVTNNASLVDVCKGADVVVNCVQYYYNVEIMKACLNVGAHYVDLGGMFHYTKKQLLLDKEFKKIGKCAILGIGAAPGISNVLAGYGAETLKKVTQVEIIFADKDNTNYDQPFVLPYSFKTLIDEFSMKPAVFQNGKVKFVEARSGEKEYDFGKEFGIQKGFLTLHSEIATLPTSLHDKGIKQCEFRVTFPHAFSETIDELIQLGFTKNEIYERAGKKTSWLDVSSVLMDRLLPKEGTKIKDKEIVRVSLNKGSIVMDALTQSDGRTSAGVLDTAIPCSVAAQLLAGNQIAHQGVLPPEKALDALPFFKQLRRRNIRILRNGKEISYG